MGAYDLLQVYLAKEPGPTLSLSFAHLEAILNRKLPKSASDYDWWWANENVTKTTHTQCLAWQRAGWKVERVDRRGKTVDFRR